MVDLNLEESGNNKKNIIKVLHIDDEEDFLIITKEFVEKLSDGGIEVESISNPLEAIERIETKTYDVIVCDYMMEELNGLDLLRKLKTHDYDIPFIIFTGRGREEVVIKALNLGADYYLRKGLDAKSQYTELVHQIKTVFKHKIAERDLRESEEKFSLFLNNVPAVAYLKDEKGRFTFFNNYLYDVYKVKPEEIIGKTATEFFGLEVGEEIEKEDRIVLEKGFWTSIGTRKLGTEEYTFKIYKFPLKREGKPTIIAGFSEDITQQREMEKVLHESEAKYRNLVESFNDIVFITDLDSRMLYANPALEHQTGFTKDDFQFTQEENPFIHPDDAERVAKFMQDFIQSDKEQSDIIENRFVDKKGRMHWYSSIISKISYEGNPALQFIVHNITKRKQLEERLKSERDISNLYLNEAGVIFAIVDENETTLQINKKLTEVLGYTEEDIIGKNWFEVIYPKELQDELKLSFQQVITGLSKPTEYIEIEMRTKNGDKKIIAWRNIALKDDSEKTTKILGTGEDITKRKEMERSLQEKEERYRTVVELSPDSIILGDLKGNIIFANKSAAIMHGLEKPEELIGSNMIEFTAPEDHQRFVNNFKESIADTQFNQSIEYTMLKKNGTHFPVELRASVIFDDQGQPYGVLCVGRDISERKKFERDLLESEVKYRGFVENFHGIAFRGTIDYSAIFFHGAVEEITGYKEEDFTEKGLKWDELIVPEDFHITQSIRDGLETEPDYKSTLEYRIRRKNGEIRWIRQYVTKISKGSNKPVIVQGTLYDITDSKKAQEIIRESEEKFRQLFHNINDAIYLYGLTEENLPGNFIEINEIASKMLEYTREEFITMSPKDIAAPEIEAKIPIFIKDLKEKKQHTFEAIHVSKSGKKIPVEISSHIFNLNDNEVILAIARDITERKRVEDELKQSETLYRITFESTGTANAIAREDTIVTLVNKRLVELFGYSKEEIEGKMSWTSFIHESELERVIEISKRRLEDSKSVPTSYETKIITKGGEIKNCILNVEIIPGTKNITVSVIDITRIKEVERELKKSENLYRAIFEATGTANAIVRKDTTISKINTRMEELSGYSKDDLEGKKWVDFVPKSELPRLKEFRELRAKNPDLAPTKYETKFITKEGVIKDILVYIDNIPRTSDSIVSLMDISDLKRIQEELEISENLYRMLFERTGTANITFDEDANVKMINSRMEKLSGYSREEVEGKKKWTDFIPEPELSMMLEYNEIRRKDPRLAPIQYDSRFVDKNGNIKNILLNVNQLPSTNIFVASLMDITAKKKVEEELKNQREELSEFAHLIAHDIRNSLSAIEGFIDLHIETKEKSYIEKVNKQTLYLRGLLDRSIELAEAGQSVEKSDDVNLNEHVKSVAEMILPKGVKLIQKDLTNIQADKNKFSQILKNLFENAIIHGKPKNITVKQLETDEEIILVIKNDGEKINPKVVKDAFETSFSTREMLEWHGLTIVKKLVTAHGWNIRLDEYDEMTCFEIIIPKKIIY